MAPRACFPPLFLLQRQHMPWQLHHACTHTIIMQHIAQHLAFATQMIQVSGPWWQYRRLPCTICPADKTLPLTSHVKKSTSSVLPNRLPAAPLNIKGPYVAGTTAYQVKPTMPSTISTMTWPSTFRNLHCANTFSHVRYFHMAVLLCCTCSCNQPPC